MVSLLITAIAPSIALLLFIYSRDKYDREPLSLLVKLFIFGAFVCIPTAIFERFLSSFSNNLYYTAFIVAAFSEESAKLLMVYRIAYKSKYFNEKLDGIIYCVFASLGFATFENILYVFGNGMSVGIVRGLLSVPGHMLFAITMGYYLALTKFALTPLSSKMNQVKALIMPLALHGIYDALALSKSRSLLGFILLILFAIFMWIINMKKLNRYVAESKKQWGN